MNVLRGIRKSHPSFPVYCMMSWTPFAVFFLLLIVKLIRDQISYLRNGRYPPGPKPKPLIGNMFDFPIEEASEVYMEWGRKYGSMSTIPLA